MFYIQLDKNTKTNQVISCFQRKNIALGAKYLRFEGPGLICFDNAGCYEHGDLLIGGEIRLYNQEELTGQLTPLAASISATAIIYAAYQKWGRGLAQHLNGDFLFYIIDKKNLQISVYRDIIGHFPVYYHHQGSKTLISDHAQPVLANLDTITINRQWMQKMLQIDFPAHTATPYNELHKVPPRHVLLATREKISISAYWNFDVQREIKFAHEKDYYALFLEKLKQAVAGRMGNGLNGFELSGGLDSATVLAMARHFGPLPAPLLKPYSQILDPACNGQVFPYKDERKEIETIHHFLGTTGTFFSTSQSPIIESLKAYMKATGLMMTQNFTTFSHNIYAEGAFDGIQTLFCGFGGDQMVSSSGFFYITELIRNNNLSALLKLMKEREHNAWGFFKFLARRSLYIKKYQMGLSRKIMPVFTSQKTLKELGLTRYIDLSRDEMPDKGNFYKTLLTNNILTPYITTRLEELLPDSRRYGFQYRTPLLDKELMETYLAFPPHIHFKPNWPRNTLRESMKGLLPEAIRTRRDKTGATIPWVHQKVVEEREALQAYLANYPYHQTLEWVDLEKLKKLLQQNTLAIQPGQFPNHRVFFRFLSVLVFFELYEKGELF
jgi:asparagine synthase (glutamine-hydrolysing)